LAQSLSSYLDVPQNEIKIKEAVDLFAFLKETVKYIEFVGKTKDYENKLMEAKRMKEEKIIKQERMKERAIKGVEANSRVIKDIIENSPRQIQKFETKVNMMLYEEGDKAAEEMRTTEKAIDEKMKYIKDLKKLKKNMIHQVNKESAEKKKKMKIEEEKNYMEYQKELVLKYYIINREKNCKFSL
jgi:hypothetical protein